MIFDICLYAVAIAGVLAFTGSNRTKPAQKRREIHALLDTIHAIGELPENCFEGDDLPSYEDLFGEADQIGDRPIYQDEDEPEADTELVEPDFEDLLAITAPRRIDTRWFHAMGTHALRTLGSIEGIVGARRWSKQQAIATLTAHYAIA